MEQKIIIQGKPIAKKRPRFYRRGKFVGTYNDQETEEGRFMWEVKSQWPYSVPHERQAPLSLRCIFYMPIPKHTSKKKRATLLYHIKKPDTSNLLKFVEDCLSGIVFYDDSQVAEVLAAKLYDENPRTEIIVKKMSTTVT